MAKNSGQSDNVDPPADGLNLNIVPTVSFTAAAEEQRSGTGPSAGREANDDAALAPFRTYGNSKGVPFKDVGNTDRDLEAMHCAELCGRHDIEDTFVQGAALAQDPTAIENHAMNWPPCAWETLENEVAKPWTSSPKMLFLVAVFCVFAAATQGVSQSAINGAAIFYVQDLHLTESTGEWINGIIMGAPFFSSAFVGCWLTAPLNNRFGRKNTVVFSVVITIVTSVAQLFCRHWWGLLVCRLVLGIAIGPKSSTVPMYSAECAPKEIRGALGVMWQMGTALGIMLGYVFDLAFFDVATGTIKNWNFMLFSAIFPALVVLAVVGFLPESPSWLMSKKKFREAFEAMQQLRATDLQAARDFMTIYNTTRTKPDSWLQQFKKIFTVPRNRHAMYASQVVMLMQQMCGMNIIAYYSSDVFKKAGFDNQKAISASLGFGLANCIFSTAGLATMDRLGRRKLLLWSFPVMAAVMLWMGLSFCIPDTAAQAKLGSIATASYVFAMLYSPAIGTVSFVYSAEAYPLSVRAVGMSVATATTWLVNGLISIAWPSMQRAMKPQGGFAFYAAWNLLGFLLTWLLVPETAGLNLQEIDRVFEREPWRDMFKGRNVKPMGNDSILGEEEDEAVSLETMQPRPRERFRRLTARI